MRLDRLRGLVLDLVRQELQRAGVPAGLRRGPIVAIEEQGGQLYATISGFPDSAGGEQLQAPIADPYGFAAWPTGDCTLVAARSGGQQVIVGAHDRTHRPSLQSGEVALYTASGGLVRLDKSGQVVLNNGTKAVARASDPCTFSLSVTVTGNPETATVTGAIQIDPSTGATSVLA